MKDIIRIADILSELRFRSDVKKIEKEVLNKQNKDILIDFDEICFMSRSFADEFFIMMENLKSDGINIQIENKCEEIKLIYETVINSRSKQRSYKSDGRLIRFKNLDDLSKFLSNY